MVLMTTKSNCHMAYSYTISLNEQYLLYEWLKVMYQVLNIDFGLLWPL